MCPAKDIVSKFSQILLQLMIWRHRHQASTAANLQSCQGFDQNDINYIMM